MCVCACACEFCAYVCVCVYDGRLHYSSNKPRSNLGQRARGCGCRCIQCPYATPAFVVGSLPEASARSAGS